MFCARSTAGIRNLRNASNHLIRNLSEESLLSPQPATRRVSIFGVPMFLGQPIDGVEKGPGLLRQFGLKEKLSGEGWDINDVGDLDIQPYSESHPKLDPKHGIAKRCFAIGRNLQNLASVLSTSIQKHDNEFDLILGGDHVIAAGSIAGILRQRPNLGVIWVDAHADINTPKTTPSGNMHGMPLGFLINGLVDHEVVPGFEWLKHQPKLSPKQIVYIGLRDVDPGEIRLIHELGILSFTMHDITRFGIGKVMDIAINHLGDVPLHLSYDIDAIDPAIAPSTGTRVVGGLTYREAHYVAEVVAETNRLRSMDMVEVNPCLSTPQDVKSTLEVAVGIVMSATGKYIL
eukprot:c15738_g1_i1.p1 GENE.c15738_g1_i1~~c15738_g1_i1.p1  ORF type:complete len:345 (-),score=169.81 c15738_g1_i1:316-1350(-)